MIALYILLALLGWLAGIVINHAADFLPRRQSIFQWPVCPECGHRLALPAWSALLALLSRRESCVHCGYRRYSLTRSVIVELVTPVLFVILFWKFGLSIRLGPLLLYTIILILITVTDLEFRLILNVVILPSIFLALIFSFVTPLSGFWTFGSTCDSLLYGIYTLFFSPPEGFWQVAFLGGAVAFIISFLAWFFAIIFYGAGALGQGDITLSTFLGLILGFPYILLTFLLTVILGGLVPFILLITRRISRKSFIPYGPFLTITGWLMLVWGNEIWLYYFC